MALEKEINQKEFRNQAHKALVGLMFTANLLEDRMETVYQQFNLTLQQYNVLRILRGSYPNPLTIQTIRARMIDRMSDASRIVDRLHGKQLVLRQVGKTDRRSTEVTITEAGLALLEELQPRVDHFESWFSRLDSEDLECLNRSLDKIIEHLEAKDAFLFKS